MFTSSNLVLKMSNPIDIRALKVNAREGDHSGRSRSGFHVYLSSYFAVFQALPFGEQSDEIFRLLEDTSSSDATLEVSDREYFDSTDTVNLPSFHHRKLFSAACKNWSFFLTSQAKEEWKKRAKSLNSRKLPGLFEGVPAELDEEEEDIYDCVSQSLTKE